MRITSFSLFCLLALALSGLGGYPKPPEPNRAAGIFSIYTPSHGLQPPAAAPAKKAVHSVSVKVSSASSSSADHHLDLSMLQLEVEERNNARAAERIRYIF